MYKFFKRFFDIIISLIALTVLSPVFLILAILVACFNGLPVIFKQPRPGKNGKIFMMYKFRSMSNKKDQYGNLLPDSQRVTKFGSFLRKTSLDELPQLWNVFKGDMSLVGPRPRLIKDAVFYPDYVKSLNVRPGITCLAHVNGRNLNTWDSVFIYDELYVERMSLKLDIKTLFQTVSVVLKKTGTNDGTQDMQDYYYADYLLRMGMISQEQYAEGINRAKRIEKEFRDSRKFRRKFNLSPTYKEVEDFDLQEKNVD